MLAYFVLLSVCTNFDKKIEDRLRLGIKNKQDLFCSSLGLH